MYKQLSFKLNQEIVNEKSEKYKDYKLTDISTFTFARTYLRNKYKRDHNNKTIYLGKENFFEVVLRIVNGTFSLIKDNALSKVKWNENNYQEKASYFFDLIYQFKVTPPGRGFWTMGTELVHKKRVALALVNCTFITSENINKIGGEFFRYVADLLMLGVGVGFDVRGAGKVMIHKPEYGPSNSNTDKYDIINYLYGIRNKCTYTDGGIRYKEYINQNGIKEFKSIHVGTKYIDHEIEYFTQKFIFHKNKIHIHVIEDSREGWGKAIKKLFESYMENSQEYIVAFDYSKVRPAGTRLITFDGTASGPEPLAEGLSAIRYLLEKNCGKLLEPVIIYDICNIIALIILSGNVRRSSEIGLSEGIESCEYKNYSNPKYKYRSTFGWCSNNSCIITEQIHNNNEEYSKIIHQICENIKYTGEPGFFNLYLSKYYGRIVDGKGYYDINVLGTNPCGEIPLEGKVKTASKKPYSGGGETCNLSEVFLPNYDGTFEEVLEQISNDIYYAVLYCKTITLIEPHWKGTAEIQDRNRRIGVSLTGIMMFIYKYNIDIFEDEKTNKLVFLYDTLFKKVKEYDEEISNMLSIPLSIKCTTVKPSGTVSLIGNVSSGVHAPIEGRYIKRIRINNESKYLINAMKKNGYHVEPCVNQPKQTTIISIPVNMKYNGPTRNTNTVEYQFHLIYLTQKYWADNQVSCTITFREDEHHKLEGLIKKYKNNIKSISFLPICTNEYPQMPEELLTEEQYNNLMSKITPITFEDLIPKTENTEIEYDNYCSGDKCVIINRCKK